MKDIKAILNIENIETFDLRCYGIPVYVELAKQKTGFGYKYFMECPKCGNRRTKLYFFRNKLVCHDCLPVRIYKQIQDTTKGGEDEIFYRMERIASKNGIRFELPFSYYQMLLGKPKHMHWGTWERMARQLQILENMRFQAIFMKMRYSPEVIRYALEHCLYEYSLADMDKYLIDWYGCVNDIKRRNNSL